MDNIIEIKDPEINTREIMDRIRSSIEKKKKEGVYSAEKLREAENLKIGDSPGRADFIRHCINTSAALSNIDIDHYRFGIPPVLNRPVLGHLVLTVKSVIRRFLRFHTRGVFTQQIEFNRHVVELIRELNGRIEELSDELEGMRGGRRP